MSEDHPRDRFDLVPDAAAEAAFLDAWTVADTVQEAIDQASAEADLTTYDPR